MKSIALLMSVVAVALPSCHRSPTSASKGVKASSAPQVIDTQWTEAAAKRTQALLAANKVKYSLPELRIYDARQQLIFHQVGINPRAVAQTLQAAIRSTTPVAGPTYAETLGDLETADYRPAAAVLRRGGAITIVDYWASWCVPCKILEKQMLAWAVRQPRGSIRIVRAEADITKLERAMGHKTFVLKPGPGGKLIKVEMK